ncbi:hypothetical protein Pelo_7323 [Pelomyxa schiedti]|nr:hypothetical protein Pelo_7323 [Pelomyxa schiedti]
MAHVADLLTALMVRGAAHSGTVWGIPVTTQSKDVGTRTALEAKRFGIVPATALLSLVIIGIVGMAGALQTMAKPFLRALGTAWALKNTVAMGTAKRTRERIAKLALRTAPAQLFAEILYARQQRIAPTAQPTVGCARAEMESAITMKHAARVKLTADCAGAVTVLVMEMKPALPVHWIVACVPYVAMIIVLEMRHVRVALKIVEIVM